MNTFNGTIRRTVDDRVDTVLGAIADLITQFLRGVKSPFFWQIMKTNVKSDRAILVILLTLNMKHYYTFSYYVRY